MRREEARARTTGRTKENWRRGLQQTTTTSISSQQQFAKKLEFLQDDHKSVDDQWKASSSAVDL
jgi:hypothetical protein